MGRRKTNPDFLTGVPEMVILQLVSQRPMHGYAIVQAIKVRSEQKLQFGEGSIYPILHRLETDKILKTRRVTVSGRERVVYAITAKGTKRLAESRSLWNQVVGAVDAVFADETDESTSVA